MTYGPLVRVAMRTRDPEFIFIARVKVVLPVEVAVQRGCFATSIYKDVAGYALVFEAMCGVHEPELVCIGGVQVILPIEVAVQRFGILRGFLAHEVAGYALVCEAMFGVHEPEFCCAGCVEMVYAIEVAV